jgi:hypothetical protein
MAKFGASSFFREAKITLTMNFSYPSHQHERGCDNTFAPVLAIVLEEARQGLTEGGVPVGAALFDAQGKVLGRGHNCPCRKATPQFTANRCISQGGAVAHVPRQDSGDDARPVLVLQRTDSPVQDQYRDRRRVRQLQGRIGLVTGKRRERD